MQFKGSIAQMTPQNQVLPTSNGEAFWNTLKLSGFLQQWYLHWYVHHATGGAVLGSSLLPKIFGNPP